jgi:hypothetical protein
MLSLKIYSTGFTVWAVDSSCERDVVQHVQSALTYSSKSSYFTCAAALSFRQQALIKGVVPIVASQLHVGTTPTLDRVQTFLL